MTKPLLMRILKISGILFFIWLLTIITSLGFFSPTKFKTLLEKNISLYTDRQFIIQGPIRWSFTQGLSLDAFDVTLSNPTPFAQNLLTIKKIRFIPHLGSVLRGKILFDLGIIEPSLNFERMSSGHSNWQDFFEKIKNSSLFAYFKSKGFVFSEFKVQKGKINFFDDQYQRHYTFEGVSLILHPLAGALSGRATPFACEFKAVDVALHVQSSVRATASFKFNQKSNKIDIQNIDIRAVLPDQTPSTLTGSIVVNEPNKTFSMTGVLEGKNIDLKNLLSKYNKKLSSLDRLPTPLGFKAKFSYQNPWIDIQNLTLALFPYGHFEGNLKLLPSWDLKTFQLNGSLLGTECLIGQLELNRFKTAFNMKDGVMEFAPIEFLCAKGRHMSTLRVDYNSSSPKYHLTYLGKDFEVNTLLTAVGHRNKISGLAHLQTTLSTQGKTEEQLWRSLSGQAALELANGNLYGIDLLHLLKHSQSTMKSLVYSSKAPSVGKLVNAELQEWQNQAMAQHIYETPFEQATATALISGGSVNYPDLKIQHPLYSIEGKGTFDLNRKVVQLQSFVHYKEPPLETPEKILQFFKETPLGIQVSGELKDLAVRPELETYAAKALSFSNAPSTDKVIVTPITTGNMGTEDLIP